MTHFTNMRTFVIIYLDLCKWTPAGTIRTGSVGVETKWRTSDMES